MADPAAPVATREEVTLWKDAPYDLADVHALKALMAGTATADQQQRAWTWFVHRAARAHKMSFDPVNDRLTSFSEGRRFVGVRALRLATAPLDAIEAELARIGRAVKALTDNT